MPADRPMTAGTPLPPEAVHLSFEAGPYRMAMGLVTVPEETWFELDDQYHVELAERRDLLTTRHAEVFGVTPGSEAARQEALDMVVDHLTRHHPAWFGRTGNGLINYLTEETWQLDKLSCDPLELAGRLVQEDLCLVQDSPDGPVFTAGIVCFPSRWRLHEKLGQPLATVHQRVPIYPDRLARPVDRFMRHIKPGHIASRLNWSIPDDAALFQPTGKWRTQADSTITSANAGTRLYLRVERQTLRRLPGSDAVLFGIRVHRYQLSDIATTPEIASRLADAVRALPAEITHYKSLPPFMTALLDWLDARAG
jgi:dimethylamine monooxygenase subunit A